MIMFGFIVFYLLPTSFAGKNVPVLMLDQDQIMQHVQVDPNPFAKLTTSSFADIVHDTIKQSEGVIIFMEDSFSVEDISTKDQYGTPFVNLRSGLLDNRVKYFPSVIEPYRLLNQIFHPQKNNVFYLSTRTKLQLMDNFKFIYIFFQDGVNETRAQALRRHDSIITEVIFVVRQLKPGPIVAFYTGKLNPVVLPKLDSPTRKSNVENKGVTVVSSGALFQLYGVYAATSTRRALFDQLPVVSEETFTRRSMSTKLGFSVYDIEFSFSFNDEGWILDYVALFELGEEVGRTVMGIGAPWNYSLYCPDPIVIINTRDYSFLTISQYQIEPRLAQSRRGWSYKDYSISNYSQTKFGQSIHCGPYFSSSILASLMVTFICLSITFYGIMTLFDCVSGDRYEDPNAKPLTHEVMH